MTAIAQAAGEPHGRPVTMADLKALVLTDWEINKRASFNDRQYRFPHLVSYFGDFDMRGLTTGMVEDYKLHRLKQGAARSTVKNEVGILRRGLNLAIEHDLLDRAPRIRSMGGLRVREGFVQPFEFRLLMLELERTAPVVRDLVGCLYHLGWRRGEIMGLKWTDVCMRTGTIRLGAERVKNRTAKTVVVPGEVRDILARRWEARQGPWVFHRSGRPVKHFRKAWDCAVGRLGRPELIPHDLRRSYARNAIQSGVDPKRVMECGGWLTMSVLFRYQIISEQEIKAALERTADYVTEAVKKAEREAAPAPAVFPDEPAAILSGPAPERPTVRWVLEFQIATLALTDKKRADTMRGQISRILVLLGDREAATIVQADFDAYRTARRGITHLGKPPTERTIIRELQWLGQALREHAKRTGGDPGAVPKSGMGRRGGRPRKEGP